MNISVWLFNEIRVMMHSFMSHILRDNGAEYLLREIFNNAEAWAIHDQSTAVLCVLFALTFFVLAFGTFYKLIINLFSNAQYRS